MGGAGNVYNPGSREAGRCGRLRRRVLGTLGTSGRLAHRDVPASRLGRGPRPTPAHPLAAAAPGHLRPAGWALLGAAVPRATSRGAAGGLRPSGPDLQRPPLAGRGARPHGVTSAAASPPLGHSRPPQSQSQARSPRPRPSREAPPPHCVLIVKSTSQDLPRTTPPKSGTGMRDGEGISGN